MLIRILPLSILGGYPVDHDSQLGARNVVPCLIDVFVFRPMRPIDGGHKAYHW